MPIPVLRSRGGDLCGLLLAEGRLAGMRHERADVALSLIPQRPGRRGGSVPLRTPPEPLPLRCASQEARAEAEVQIEPYCAEGGRKTQRNSRSHSSERGTSNSRWCSMAHLQGRGPGPPRVPVNGREGRARHHTGCIFLQPAAVTGCGIGTSSACSGHSIITSARCTSAFSRKLHSSPL